MDERSRSPRLEEEDLQERRRASDFWSSPKEMQVWRDEATQQSIRFQARLVQSRARQAKPGEGLPVAFLFGGLGHEPWQLLQLPWDRAAPFPYVLVVPCRPEGRWWFIDDESDWGWIEGQFSQELVDAYVNWIKATIDHPRLDARRLGLFGFSAGAYAAAELFARAGVKISISGLGLGGLHGHGQSTLEGVPQKRRRAAVRHKFQSFLERLNGHKGARIQVVHGKTDLQSPWKDAKKIVDALKKRQRYLGFPEVKVSLLEADQQDSAPWQGSNKTCHDYMKAAFMSKKFFEELLCDRGCLEAEAAEAWEVMPAMPQTTLKVSDFAVSSKSPSWEVEAYEIFRQSGFVVVEHVLDVEQCDQVLEACRELAKAIVGPKGAGNRSYAGRYSFGVASSTGSILHVPRIARHLLNHAGLVLHQLLCLIFGDEGTSNFQCYSGGGDFVLPGVTEYQHLHADLQCSKSLDVNLPPPYLSVNFAVQELTPVNGPMRIVPGKRERDWRSREEPDKWRFSKLCPVGAGAALVRDVRILHGGTPNASDDTRFLPSVEYVSGQFRASGRKDVFPPWKVLPQEIYQDLDPQIQALCAELVQGDEPWTSVTYSQSQ